MRNISLALLLGISVFITGCNLSPSQGKVVAQNAGLAAAVTWIAYDDPNASEKAVVRTVISVIRAANTDLEEGQTYSEVLYPIIMTHLDEAVADGKIKPNERPLGIAGSLALLNGLDLLFASNPDWLGKEKTVRGIINSFLMGAEQGLNLADDDPRMLNATKSYERRARVFVTE